MKTVRVVILCILLAGLLTLFQSSPILAQDQEEKIELEPTYRTLEATAPGASFEFEVTLKYQGSTAREFDLAASGPQGWTIYVKPSYGEQRIGSIRLEPNKEYPDKVRIAATPPFYITPEPGEYKVTMEATAGNIRSSVELTSVITAT